MGSLGTERKVAGSVRAAIEYGGGEMGGDRGIEWPCLTTGVDEAEGLVGDMLVAKESKGTGSGGDIRLEMARVFLVSDATAALRRRSWSTCAAGVEGAKGGNGHLWEAEKGGLSTGGRMAGCWGVV